MRLLWLESADSPWSKGEGWTALSECDVDVVRTLDAGEAQLLLASHDPDVFVVSADVPGALDVLTRIRPQSKKTKPKVILISSSWGKAEFKDHSRTPGGAHRYAKTPMPINGFLKVLEDLMGVKLERRETPPPLASPIDEPAPVEREMPSRPLPLPAAALKEGDIEVLRKYLRMKEDELNGALMAQEEIRNHNMALQKEAHDLQLRLREKEHVAEEASSKAQSTEKEREELEQKLQQEREHLENEVSAYQERIKQLEKESEGSGDRYEELRNRVRKDIRRIRAHERELEAKLELARKDSETLLHARDLKVLELQRRIDALEFDLDQIQDSRVQAEMEAERYLAKLSRVARALHIAIGMVEEDVVRDKELDELEPFVIANNDDSQDSGHGSFGGGSGTGGPAGRDAPATEPESADPADLDALASDGEPTRIVSLDELKDDSENDPGEALG